MFCYSCIVVKNQLVRPTISVIIIAIVIQGRNLGQNSGGTNLGEDNVASLGTYRQFDFLV